MKISTKDTANLLRKISPTKVWNAGQLVSSYYLSRQLKRPLHRGLPSAIAIEPTTACNLRCPECPSGLRSFSRPTGMLQQGLFQQIIDELQSTLIYLTFYFQGEPYLHPQFTEMVRYAHARKIYTATSTNAHFLSEENACKTVESGLDRLIVSLDGTSQEVYEKYRIGGKMDKVIAGVKNIIRLKKILQSDTPEVVLQFLVVAPNEHQIPELYKLAAELGVNAVALKTAQIYDYKHGSPLIPSQDRFSRYRQQADGTWEAKNALVNSCWKMWHSCVITWDGKIVPCCFDKDAQHAFGDMASGSTFHDIWRSPAYNAFRAALLRSRAEITICKNCSEGTKVWA